MLEATPEAQRIAADGKEFQSRLDALKREGRPDYDAEVLRLRQQREALGDAYQQLNEDTQQERRERATEIVAGESHAVGPYQYSINKAGDLFQFEMTPVDNPGAPGPVRGLIRPTEDGIELAVAEPGIAPPQSWPERLEALAEGVMYLELERDQPEVAHPQGTDAQPATPPATSESATPPISILGTWEVITAECGRSFADFKRSGAAYPPPRVTITPDRFTLPDLSASGYGQRARHFSAALPPGEDLEDVVNQVFLNDPEVRPVVDEIQATHEQLKELEQRIRRPADPTLVGLRKKGDDLQKSYAQLWSDKKDGIRARVRTAFEQGFGDFLVPKSPGGIYSPSIARIGANDLIVLTPVDPDGDGRHVIRGAFQFEDEGLSLVLNPPGESWADLDNPRYDSQRSGMLRLALRRVQDEGPPSAGDANDPTADEPSEEDAGDAAGAEAIAAEAERVRGQLDQAGIGHFEAASELEAARLDLEICRRSALDAIEKWRAARIDPKGLADGAAQRLEQEYAEARNEYRTLSRRALELESRVESLEARHRALRRRVSALEALGREGDSLLVPGDVLRIEVKPTGPNATTERALTGERTVRLDGTVGLDFYGDLPVAGRTRAQVKEAVIERLRRWYDDESLGLRAADGSVRPPGESDRVFVDIVTPTAAQEGPDRIDDRLEGLERRLDRALEAQRPSGDR